MSRTRTAIVIVGGDPLSPHAVRDLPPDAFIVAADSGLDHALAAGLVPSSVVGDLDSISSEGLAWAHRMDITVDAHPADKDSTDTELALAAAVAAGATHVLLLGGGGDRLDHTLAALTALGHSSLAECDSVTGRWGTTMVQVLHGPRTANLRLPLGATFSLLALHGEVQGVTLSGARWPLHAASIHPASSLGISNQTDEPDLHVSIAAGILTIVIPNHFGDHP
ncbi:unannotated protein [freshwater metagenome]|uniref:Unannotated protein n=1 Tax=freshwater metagenome TaxID=449393 RepID=A0A6J7EMM0_9ZZZZ